MRIGENQRSNPQTPVSSNPELFPSIMAFPNSMRRLSPILIFLPLALLAALLLGGCDNVTLPFAATSTPTATATPLPTPTPTNTPTPTPIPAILQVPLQDYQAANKLFRIQIPEHWQAFDDGGGVRFQDRDDPYVSLTAFHFPLPPGTDPQDFLQEEARRALARAQLNDPNSLQVMENELSDDGRLHIEAVGKFFENQPLQHLLTETWVENGVLLGLSLMAPEEEWPDIGPIWPVVRKSYQTRQPDPDDVVGMAYVHPGGLFTITAPLFWGISYEDYDGVILQDMQGLAQFGVSVEELDHYPTPQEMDAALAGMVGDLPQVAGYQELEKNVEHPNRRLIRFEVPTDEDGIYRTELRVFSDRNLLITTSFSAPPHDWDFFAPDYKLLLESIETRGDAPPDEQTQDEDPLAGIEVGVPMFYLDRNGSLQVSAPIRNFRTRNITRLSASIKLYDKSGHFLAAESWRMLQRILGQGETAYLYLALPPATTDLKQVASVKIQLINARDVKQQPYPSWRYEDGRADINKKGDVIINATLRNAGKKVQKYIFITALLYDEHGNLTFAKTERKRLRYATPPGQDVDVRIVIPGPFEGLGAFDVLGERPLLD